ncbi:MAG: hypothetical protein JW862_12165 [Anaerolineales bacterium]|nr:hypothetical protein [Anaerolineales bacterium]
MLKKLVITTAALVLLGAIGFSAFNAFASPGEQAVIELPAETQIAQSEISSEVSMVEIPASAVQVVPSAELDLAAPDTAQTNLAAVTSLVDHRVGQAAAPVPQTGYQAGSQGSAAANATGQGQGNGNQGSGRGNRWQSTLENANGNQGGTAEPDPQNGFTGWVTYSGTVSQYTAPNFILTTAAGESIPAQLGNLSYVTSLGLQLVDGDWVTVNGYWETSGSLAIAQITLADGSSFTLRDAYGRPLWGGGPQH